MDKNASGDIGNKVSKSYSLSIETIEILSTKKNKSAYVETAVCGLSKLVDDYHTAKDVNDKQELEKILIRYFSDFSKI